MRDCANGVKYFERLLAVDPNSCDAKKSLGFAYFGGNICPKNYTKALGYLKEAYDCISAKSGACGDVDVVLWVAQCYHLRAVERRADDETASSDFRNANEWYQKCLKCDPGNIEAKEGIEQTSFEF
jgi:TPR repeat protein